MVQIDISKQITVLASDCEDVSALINHPALGDRMIVDEFSSRCDGVERSTPAMVQSGVGSPTPVTVQGGVEKTTSETVQTGIGCMGTHTAVSLQDGGKSTSSVDEGKPPTLADLLKSKESLRKDKIKAKAQYCVELPQPKASDIEAIMKLYADGGHPEWSVLAEKWEAARPFQIVKATCPMILETGQALTRTPNGNNLSSLTRDHGNPVFGSLLDSKQITQVSKLPGGNIRLMVTTEDACQQLECQSVNILGETFFPREYNSLEFKYHLDVFGVGVEDERVGLLRSLNKIGCPVVYDTFREAIPTKGVAMSTWRVYFGSTTCPEQLIRVGKVCEQLWYGKQLYTVRGKNAPIPTERPGFGTKLHSRPTKQPPIVATTTANVPVQKQENKVEVNVARKLSDAISLEFNSTINITLPASPTFNLPRLPLLQLETSPAPLTKQDRDVTMQLARSRGKRHRTEPFQQMVSKARSRALPGLVISNYYSVLPSMEVELEEIEVVDDPAHGHRIQIIPVKARMTNTVATSK
uniref:AlNc14C176G8117 protein n=1 Tax=Albugo laibachii Nc14 TaxID=890382 RepID=F0WNW2_9STRA|nr:AlNc14C176G8117 [Albugo laibachii Nc14]|eukprot:CCA23005.1 AlNc14C176G8117 [Albugo laibachii Nc14]